MPDGSAKTSGARPRTSQPGGGRVAAIDALRGVAVLAVLASHVPFSMAVGPVSANEEAAAALPVWLSEALEHGVVGVHLFLIVSGFCIHMAWARRATPGAAEAISFGSFWRRRLHRLYPPYVIVLGLSLCALLFQNAVLGSPPPTLPGYFGYASGSQLALDLFLLLLLAQNVNGASHRVGNGPFWTLALEEQLYMLYFPLLWLRRRHGWTRTLLTVGVATALWRAVACYAAPEWFPTMLVMGPARWFEWALGALAVEAHLGRTRLPRWCASAGVAAGLLCVAMAVTNLSRLGFPRQAAALIHDPIWGLTFFVVLNTACRLRWAEAKGWNLARGFAWVGTFSYSLYLTHSPVIVGVKQLALRAGVGVGGILALRLLLPIVVAWAFYQLVERRFLRPSRKDSPLDVRALAEPVQPSPPGRAGGL